jgi:hypothetical protein
MKIIVSILSFTALLVSCKKNSSEVVNTETASLIVQYKNCGLTAPITKTGNHQALICFDTVYNDSRCPIGAVCIWEGFVHVGLTYKANGQNIPFQLSSLNRPFMGITAKNDTTINGIKIKLIDVLPYPDWNAPVNVNDYKVQLQIEQ